MFQRCVVLRPHHGFIHQWVYFPIFQRCTVFWFLMVSSPVNTLSHVSEFHGLLVSSGFHSPLSSLPRVSEVHGSLVSLGSHSPGNSLFRVSEVRALWLHHGFIHLWVYFPVFQRCTVYWFPQGFNSSEYTCPCVRGTRFSNFFRVSFTCEFTFHLSEVHSLVVSLGFHSPVSSVSHV